MSDYDSLIKAYPAPQLDREMYHPRREFDIPPHQRVNQGRSFQESNFRSDIPKFRSFDEEDETEPNPIFRNEFPPNHNLPNLNSNQTYIAPYQHVMKKSGNAEKMKEIFGENQVFTSMDTINFPSQTRVQSEQFKPVSSPAYTGYVPKMKVLEGPEMKIPVREGFSSSNTPAKTSNKPYSVDRVKIYNAILQYFPGYVMTKTAQHGPFGIYKAIVQCLLCNGVRYAVVIVEESFASIGEKRNLSELAWESFQTRYTEDDKEAIKFQIGTFGYGHPEGKSILDDTIRLTRETKESFKYACDNLPLSVELLKVREDENMAETGTIASALETFSCVLSFSD